ncbi:hypothetical protein BAURA63_03861 [Brevibacterium aurantiacum]|uniref:Uncharacterized protein n=1 Tax=Brevibacterium aurantiacum TaxID=273384 RepID=A0A2H1KWP7_BREAU|nr:hypothetical protein BAURA63_03861 [Brevibacterium aurantiacum]
MSRRASNDPLSPPLPQTYAEIDIASREHYAKMLRASLSSFVGASAITTLVWLAEALFSGGFSLFWPTFVLLGTGINGISTHSSARRNSGTPTSAAECRRAGAVRCGTARPLSPGDQLLADQP